LVRKGHRKPFSHVARLFNADALRAHCLGRPWRNSGS
jgi:hypothetical protein